MPTVRSDDTTRQRTRSDSADSPNRKPLRWGFLCLVWIAIALMMATQTYIYQSALHLTFRDIPVRWAESFRFPVVECLFWALLTPAVLRLSERFPLASPHWPKSIGVLVLCNATVELLHALYRAPLHPFVYPRMIAIPFPRLVKYYLVGNALNDAWVFWTILVIGQFVESYTRRMEQERELARAQLQALTAQLQPHFLFNVLNSVSSLMRHDVEAADEMIERLSDLMRTTLKASSPQEVSLWQELEVVNKYIEIERMRFLDRLRFAIHASDEVLGAAVPILLLLPIVENAIRYAITPRTSGGRIDIEALRERDMLAVRVKDDGPGIQNDFHVTEGVGLSNTRTRLHKHYSGSASFAYRNVKPMGFEVEFRLPFRLTVVEVRDDTGVARG